MADRSDLENLDAKIIHKSDGTIECEPELISWRKQFDLAEARDIAHRMMRDDGVKTIRLTKDEDGM